MRNSVAAAAVSRPRPRRRRRLSRRVRTLGTLGRVVFYRVSFFFTGFRPRWLITSDAVGLKFRAVFLEIGFLGLLFFCVCRFGTRMKKETVEIWEPFLASELTRPGVGWLGSISGSFLLL